MYLVLSFLSPICLKSMQYKCKFLLIEKSTVQERGVIYRHLFRKWRLQESQFKKNLGKILMRPYLNKEARHGQVCL
jgi:hypothetical protein